MNLRKASGGAAIALALTLGWPAAAQLDATVNAAEQSTDDARESQLRIDNLEEERGDLFREYRATLQRIESQRLFIQQQEVFLRSQENELIDLARQIEEVGDITRSLYPMQVEMIDVLEQFVNLDIPFMLDDRRDRIARLREIMADHNVAPAERYRLIIEAYQIETDYGRFIDTYVGPIGEGADQRLVDFLMLGRVAFIYMTQDETEAGIWNAETRSWDRLPDSFRLDLRRAIRMAKEITTPNVFLAPIPGPTTAGAAADEG